MTDVDWACPAVVDCLWRRLLSPAWCVRAGDGDHPLSMFLLVSSVRNAFLPAPSRRAALAAMCGLSPDATMARCLYVAESSQAMGTLVRALGGPTTVVSGSYAAYLLRHTWSEPRAIPPRCIDVVVASDGALWIWGRLGAGEGGEVQRAPARAAGDVLGGARFVTAAASEWYTLAVAAER